jgi:hypothetical protein
LASRQENELVFAAVELVAAEIFGDGPAGTAVATADAAGEFFSVAEFGSAMRWLVRGQKNHAPATSSRPDKIKIDRRERIFKSTAKTPRTPSCFYLGALGVLAVSLPV